MATKKCPKCGEENPAEAVMCWACYTPLAGGAAAVAGGGLVAPRGGAAAVTPAATAAAEDQEKTPVDPKIFVVVGLLIVAAVIGAFTTGLIGGGGNSNELPSVTPIENPGPPGGNPPPGPQPPAQPPQMPTFKVPSTTPGGESVKPQFQPAVPPDPRQTTGTMGIIVNTPGISPIQAASLAKFAKQTYESGGRWTAMQVVVFSDAATAKTFLKYQAQRKGARLTPYEYQDLANQGLWNNVIAYYETQGKKESRYYPSANPKGWWSRSN